MSRWYLGATRPAKVIHREGCRYARVPYRLLDPHPTLGSVVSVLEDTGADAWYRFCRICIPEAAER